MMQPDITNYLDYRSFLKDFYAYKKHIQPGYSYRVFARAAGLGSANYLKLVIDGDRRITERSLDSFIKGLGLSAPGSEYFRLLVQFAHSHANERKEALLARLLAKRLQTQVLNPKQEESVLQRWHHWAIRELTQLKSFRSDGEWIARKLGGAVSPEQAEHSLEMLVRSGLLQLKDGRYIPTSPKVATRDEITNKLLQAIHIQFVDQGVRSVLHDPVEKREVGGLTIALKVSDIPRLKEKIKKFRRELNEEFSSPAGDELYHLEMLFFPLSKEEVK